MQKLATVLFTCALAVGCSSGATYAPGNGPASSTTSTPPSEEDAADESELASDGGTNKGSRFDLSLTVSEKLETGAAASTVMFIAVRDADTHELVAIAHDEENVATKTKLTKKGILKRGHRYEIGIKDAWYAQCLDSSANVWYREIPAVSDHVTLDVEVRADVDEDPRGCDVLHEPVPLPSGTYSTKAAINGVAGNRVTVYVSPSGRLYTTELRVFCATSSSSCVPTVLSHGTCDREQVVYPGETTFSLGDASASRTTVKGSATIDVASKTIHYTGRTYTWTGTSSICCDDTFDVTLEKVSANAAGCP